MLGVRSEFGGSTAGKKRRKSSLRAEGLSMNSAVHDMVYVFAQVGGEWRNEDGEEFSRGILLIAIGRTSCGNVHTGRQVVCSNAWQ